MTTRTWQNVLAEIIALKTGPTQARWKSAAKDKAFDLIRGQLVAIYTLTHSAGERAKQMLEAMFDGLTVRLSNDLVGSEQLKALARHADWFILATRSAKHAATEFIKAERPRGKREVLYSTGKGASSLVSALLTALLD